jgi:membrane protein DedA with SNARE-associated domain
MLEIPIEAWLLKYGYAILFGLLTAGIMGVPLPDELLLMTSGFLVWKGKFKLWVMILAASGGSACGITVSYVLGRTLGLALLHRYGRYVGVSSKRLDRAHAWFERWGRWALLAGYFVPGFRHFTAISAGATHMEWPHFALFAYAGAVLWTASFILVGYFLGPKVPDLAPIIMPYARLIAACAAAALTAGLILRFLWRRKKQQDQTGDLPHK